MGKAKAEKALKQPQEKAQATPAPEAAKAAKASGQLLDSNTVVLARTVEFAQTRLDLTNPLVVNYVNKSIDHLAAGQLSLPKAAQAIAQGYVYSETKGMNLELPQAKQAYARAINTIGSELPPVVQANLQSGVPNAIRSELTTPPLKSSVDANALRGIEPEHYATIRAIAKDIGVLHASGNKDSAFASPEAKVHHMKESLQLIRDSASANGIRTDGMGKAVLPSPVDPTRAGAELVNKYAALTAAAAVAKDPAFAPLPMMPSREGFHEKFAQTLVRTTAELPQVKAAAQGLANSVDWTRGAGDHIKTLQALQPAAQHQGPSR
jgi:hypothetical protein